MYKLLWNTVNRTNAHIDRKKLFISMSVLFNTIIGLLIWLLIGRIFLPQIEWLVCFVGYMAVVAGYIGGIIYLYRNT